MAGRYFKNKTNYYKKELAVKEFNAIYGDWDQYIKQYNRNYVSAQKEKLEGYFNNIEGKSITELMEIFGRNKGAIESRIKKLELEEKYKRL